jgi:hypothetical protein
MGVAAMSTMSSGRSPQHVRASYGAVGESTAAYAAGRARDTHLSMSARAASGDAHFERIFDHQPRAPAGDSVPPTPPSIPGRTLGPGRVRSPSLPGPSYNLCAYMKRPAARPRRAVFAGNGLALPDANP